MRRDAGPREDDAPPSQLGGLIVGGRWNAAVAWSLVGVLVVLSVESLADGDLQWIIFPLMVAVLAVLPPWTRRDPREMLPWPLLAVISLPLAGRAMQVSVLGNRVALAFSLAAVALLVTVELDVFTPIEMTSGFAVGFVTVGTLAAAGWWAVLLWLSDVLQGTRFLVDHDALMMGFIYAAVAGLVTGVLFDRLFRRYGLVEVR